MKRNETKNENVKLFKNMNQWAKNNRIRDFVFEQNFVEEKGTLLF